MPCLCEACARKDLAEDVAKAVELHVNRIGPLGLSIAILGCLDAWKKGVDAPPLACDHPGPWLKHSADGRSVCALCKAWLPAEPIANNMGNATGTYMVAEVEKLRADLRRALAEIDWYKDAEERAGEREQAVRADYLTVADALLAESTGPEQLAEAARLLRAEKHHHEWCNDCGCAHADEREW
jgi:hypothetical protein